MRGGKEKNEGKREESQQNPADKRELKNTYCKVF